MAWFPRIVDRAKVTHRRAAAIGEFVHVEFTQKHNSGSLQPRDDFSVFLRYSIFEYGASCGCPDACRVEQIFERNRDTVQRAAPFAALNFLLRLLGRLHCQVGCHSAVRV